MKKFLQIMGFVLLGVVLAAYLCFLFVLPNVIDLNQYKPLVKDLAKEQGKVDLDFGGAKVITSPLLGAGVKIDNITVKLPDGSLLLSAESLKTRVSLPSILLMTVKVSCFEIEKPFINLEIAEDNVDYKVVKLVENILNENKEKTLGEEKVVTQTWFNPNWIRIKVPCAKLHNYKILVNDIKTGHYLDLHGEELKAGYFNKKTAKLKTYAELFSDENKNLSVNLDINTFLPQTESKLDAEDDPAERIDVPFVNPVDLYRTYNLKADIDAKLRVREHKGDITSFGHINIDGVTLKVSHLLLPESYVHIKTFNHTVDVDTNIYPAQEQNIQLLGKLNYSRHPWIDMNIKTGVIQYNDMLILAKAFLDSLRIPNELGQFKASGTTVADCYIKSNFKKLKSSGYIKVQNGGLAVRNLGQVISNANINALLDNSILRFNNSSLFVNKSKVTVDGSINEKSVADIMIKTDKMPLPSLFYAFAPRSLRNAYNFRSGDVTLNADIKGKLKEVTAKADFGLDNFDLSDRKNTFNIKDEKLTGQVSYEAKGQAVAGHADNKNFAFVLPKTNSSVRIPDFALGIGGKNILIPENKLLLNDKSEIKFSGNVLDYEKLKSVELLASGNVSTDDLIKLIGREFKPFIHSKGAIPVKLTVYGNKKKQTVFAQALADKDNFITPVDFTELGGKQTALQTVVDMKPGRIKIKKTGVYIRTVSVDEEGNEVVSLDDVLDIDGTIVGDRINLLKVNLPKIISGKIYAFPQSSLVRDKARLFVYGPISNPIIRGGINVRDIKIPELLTSVDNIKLDFKGHTLGFDLSNILLNQSDISVNGNLDLNPSPIMNLSGVNVTSNNINLERMLKVVDRAMKYVPSNGKVSSNSAQSASTNIPVEVQSGTINMRRIQTGNIVVTNTTSRMALRQNILGLRGLRTNIFNGQVNGDVFVNLVKTLVNVDLKGENINVAKAMLDAAGMKDMLSGIAKFDAKLSIDGTAKTPTEQMKGINGDINFEVVNGQFGPFGKIENLIIAENIRESQFFQTALGGIINSLTSIDTTHFDKLTGHLNMNGGICHIDPITSLGNVLTLHIFGDFDLVRNYADMKVRAKMSSIISKVLGPLNAINPVNLMNSAASMNIVTAKAFSLFCEVVPENELAALPAFENSYVDSGAAKFQLKVRGDAAKPLTLVKSFKWLSSKTEYDEAVEFVNSLPEEIEGSTATNIEEAIAEAKALEAEKKTFRYKVKHLFDKGVNKGENKGVSTEAKNEPVEDATKAEKENITAEENIEE